MSWSSSIANRFVRRAMASKDAVHCQSSIWQCSAVNTEIPCVTRITWNGSPFVRDSMFLPRGSSAPVAQKMWSSKATYMGAARILAIVRKCFRDIARQYRACQIELRTASPASCPPKVEWRYWLEEGDRCDNGNRAQLEVQVSAATVPVHKYSVFVILGTVSFVQHMRELVQDAFPFSEAKR